MHVTPMSFSYTKQLINRSLTSQGLTTGGQSKVKNWVTVEKVAHNQLHGTTAEHF